MPFVATLLMDDSLHIYLLSWVRVCCAGRSWRLATYPFAEPLLERVCTSGEYDIGVIFCNVAGWGRREAVCRPSSRLGLGYWLPFRPGAGAAVERFGIDGRAEC